MPKIIWHGTREELMRALRRLPRILAGKDADPSGTVEGMQLRLGAVLLSHIKDAYATKAGGGTDEMGISWAPLAPSTLALRNKITGQKTLNKLKGTLKALPLARKRLIAIQRKRLLDVYGAGRGARQQRNQALRFLKRMKPYISASRYKKLVSEIKQQKPDRARKLAFSGGFAEILRDTGILMNSLSPGTMGGDNLLRSLPGKVIVGSNVRTASGINLLDLHDSDAPRKKKKDGTDRLPRRQVLPDAQHPIPQQWWDDMLAAYTSGMRKKDFWKKLLGQRAS